MQKHTLKYEYSQDFCICWKHGATQEGDCQAAAPPPPPQNKI